MSKLRLDPCYIQKEEAMKTVGLYADPNKKQAIAAAEEIIPWLSSRNLQAIPLYETQIPLLSHLNFIISFGGDGTLLRIARKAAPYRIPIMAVDLGGLAFLSAVRLSETKEYVEKILNHRYKIEERMMLIACIYIEKKEQLSVSALNEVVIQRGEAGRLVHLKTYFDDKEGATYSADGLIIATPTGSTAYSLSAGGPIVSPKVEGFVITAISPHMLSARPIVISSQEKIKIVNLQKKRKLLLNFDGQETHTIDGEDYILIKRADYCTRLIVFREHFYKKLRSRLKWAEKYKRMEL